ncbi:MAG: O-methyltransferase [Lachnospiraceae bacterium]|nr:O-methyltransferase [Lachnospiraceae bacterium]
MIVNERITDYINSMNKEDADWLFAIETKAREDNVPIIRKETKELLKTLLRIKQPKRILEVGTAVGYSALYMKEHVSPDTELITIENYPPRIEEASSNFQKWDKNKKITLIPGDAAFVLKELEEPFDFIFMDAAKGQYIHFLPDIIRLLKQGGILLSDNVLQDGDIIESRYAIKRRNHTIHSRMREYLYVLKNSKEFTTSIIPIGDGVALSVKEF